ncbi:MAG TPA: acyl-CoA thioesterase [Thermodesulfobacteriota bacterium]|nr:acyl-CoA thioesterase [Thermodesulfobacteriota bacterium]
MTDREGGMAERLDPDTALAPRPVSASRVVMSRVMQPTDANIMGKVHGGVIMRLMDEAAGTAAARHCRRPVVTAAIDSLSFLSPVSIGHLVTVRASVNDTGRTSMEVGVRVEAEDVLTGEVTHTSSGYLVFVALGDDGRPVPVPPVLPETEEDRRRQREARERRARRLAARSRTP